MDLSLIIATHARPDSLRRLIESIGPQFDSTRHELIIAENGTPLPTPISGGEIPLAHLAHVHQPRAGKCRAQNRAIEQAHGDIIVCLDDDLVVSPNYLASVSAFFSQHSEFAAMKGRILAAENPAAKAGADACYIDLPIADHGETVQEVKGVLGANMAFRAWLFQKIGKFDERLGPGACGHEEETEFSARIRKAGLKIGYAPAALVLHEVDPARANRQRFIRIARERGRCRMIHERHGRAEIIGKILIGGARLAMARALGAPPTRIAKEERRLAVARGMLDGLRKA